MPTTTQIRLNNITTCLTATVNTLKILESLQTPFLEGISNTIQSLVEYGKAVKQNRSDCVYLMEQTHELVNAIIVAHIKSDTAGGLPPRVLNEIGNFTRTLHKIHTFVEAQQNGHKIRMLFQQGKFSTLFKDCKAGLQRGFEFFQVIIPNTLPDVRQMQQHANEQHQAVLNMIEALSSVSVSDNASTVIDKQNSFRFSYQFPLNLHVAL
ncbi:hypothetical protein MVEN_00765900 [Mycena venus]|uniref:Uncharacterized protein n=1 Tax=Mycena venus TaxID=2733690 RepID=A0A8H6YJT4_9AGAR|nr:hypothetical protein MVEN_00765900 [Mycena venus]